MAYFIALALAGITITGWWIGVKRGIRNDVVNSIQVKDREYVAKKKGEGDEQKKEDRKLKREAEKTKDRDKQVDYYQDIGNYGG